MGLNLNISKCELVCHPRMQITDPLFQSFQRCHVGDSSLLGTPLFLRPRLDDAWSVRLADLSRAADRLHLISAQDALVFLRASFGSPRVQHLMRCSPSVDHTALQKYDSILRSAICKITNCSHTDNQWLQASLPVRDGGLGIRRVSSLALPAFLASAASTLTLQDAILSRSQASALSCPFFSLFSSGWSSVFGDLPPDQPMPGEVVLGSPRSPGRQGVSEIQFVNRP